MDEFDNIIDGESPVAPPEDVPVAPPEDAPVAPPADDEVPDQWSDPPQRAPFVDATPVQPPIDTELTLPFAHFGGCWDGIVGSNVDCQLLPGACHAERPFVSGLRIDELAGPELRCHAEDMPTNRCLGAGTLGMCSVGGCPGAATTDSNDGNCDLVRDRSNDVATMYGGCQEIFSNRITGCFWSQADCHHRDTSQERWLTADHLVEFAKTNKPSMPKGYCDCGDVKVGACRTRTGLMCAVDARQCGPGEAFVSARTMQDNPSIYGILDCRLCHPSDLSSQIYDATTSFLSQGGALPSSSSSSTSSLDEDIGVPNTGNKSYAPSEAGIIAGAVIGGVIGLLVLVCLGICAYKNCGGGSEIESAHKSPVDEEQQREGAPVEDVPAVAAGVVS